MFADMDVVALKSVIDKYLHLSAPVCTAKNKLMKYAI